MPNTGSFSGPHRGWLFFTIAPKTDHTNEHRRTTDKPSANQTKIRAEADGSFNNSMLINCSSIKECPMFPFGHFCFDGPFFSWLSACTCERLVRLLAAWLHVNCHCTTNRCCNSISKWLSSMSLLLAKSRLTIRSTYAPM